MKTNTTKIRLGGLASTSLAAAIAMGSGGATAYAEPPPSLPDPASGVTTDAIGQFHVIRLSNTNLCIQALNRSTQDVIVVLSQCDPSAPAQNWIFSRQASGDFEILNPNGKCLYVNGGSDVTAVRAARHASRRGAPSRPSFSKERIVEAR